MENLPPFNIWDRPSFNNIGDTEANIIYTEVGRALTGWELIDQLFAFIFSILVDDKTQAAERAYGCVESNKTKIQMINEASEVFFKVSNIPQSDELVTSLKALLKHYERANSVRNDIAHSEVVNVGTEEGPSHFLVPPPHRSRHFRAWLNENEILENHTLQHAKYKYTALDVNKVCSNFKLLFRCALSWATKVKIEYKNL